MSLKRPIHSSPELEAMRELDQFLLATKRGHKQQLALAQANYTVLKIDDCQIPYFHLAKTCCRLKPTRIAHLSHVLTLEMHMAYPQTGSCSNNSLLAFLRKSPISRLDVVANRHHFV